MNQEEEELTVIEEPIENPHSPHAYFSKQTALARDRFAAFLIDTFLLVYPVVGIKTFSQNLIHQYGFEKSDPLLQSSFTGILCLFTVLLYYVLFESVLGATIGKLLCRLRVVNLEGERASVEKNMIRNLLRLIDYPLLFLVAILSMESSPLNQRLGDRLSQTMVIKKTRKRLTPLDLKDLSPSSTLIRIIAFLIDSLLFLTFLWLYASNLNPDLKTLFPLLLNFFPFFVFFYFFLFEFLVSSTPGKILMGRKTVLENGEPCDGTAALLKNVSKPFDLILGYPLIVLTPKKQRIGDLISETVVIQKREKSGLIATATLLIVLGTLGYLSRKNSHREELNIQIKTIGNQLLQKTFGLNPYFSHPREKEISSIPPLPETMASPLKISEFYFSAGPDLSQIRSDGIFHRGDLIFIFFKLTGFQKSGSGEINLLEDISLKDPVDIISINRSEVVHLSQIIPQNSEIVLFANQLQLPKGAVLGTYRLQITIRDEIGKTKLIEEKNFVLQ